MNTKRLSINQNQSLELLVSEYYECNGHVKHSTEEQQKLISIIIPLYNEEKSIKNVIEKIPHNLNCEVIIVDDGSTDRSLEEIMKVNNRFIKIVKHRKNIGYGAALLTGFKYANGDIIITLDSDGQHCPEEIPRLLKPIINNKADLAIGSRYLGKIHYSIPIHIKFGEYFIRKFLRILYKGEVANNQSGFRAFNKSLLTQFEEFYDCQMAFSTELLCKTFELEKNVVEVPISLKPRKYGHSYVKLIRILINIFKCCFIYGLKRNKISRKILDKYLDFLFKKKY